MKRKHENEKFVKKRPFRNGLREFLILKHIHRVETPYIIKSISENFYSSLEIDLIFPILEKISIPLASDELPNLLNDMLRALARLESCDIEHRDINPNNIMYDRSKKLYILIDFDSARIHKDDDIGYNNITAPPECRPIIPELPVIQEKGKADVYALAFTVLIFSGINPEKNLSPRYSYYRKWMDDIPLNLMHILSLMLIYDPDIRASASELTDVIKNDRIKKDTKEPTKKILNILFSIVPIDKFEKHVIEIAENILSYFNSNSSNYYSYLLGSLEIAGILAGNKNYEESFFINLHEESLLHMLKLKKENQNLLDRRFVLMDIIRTKNISF